MHGIFKPIDRIISTEGTEWHDLAEKREVINRSDVNCLCPRIVSGKMLLSVGAIGTVDEMKKRVFGSCQKTKLEDGNPMSPEQYAAHIVQLVQSEVSMSNHQGLVADYRECRPDLIDSEETSNGYVPLHIPKASYVKIENGEVADSMFAALRDIDARVTCAGTLEAGKKFFLSAALGDGQGKFKVQTRHGEDEFFANLNFITSHDGTLAVEAYDSTIRIVCMNTLRWSRDAAGDVKFKVYHSKNASTAIANLGDLVNRILSGRADFKNQMEYLSSVDCSIEDARALLTGYMVEVTSCPSVDLNLRGVTRRQNSTEEILRLFVKGQGNEGKSLYDLLNGVTEYYTSGDGTGQDTGKEEKAYKANFGRAADHKNAFANMLLSEERRAEVLELGRANKL